jgi:hypothetical protein
VFQGYRRVGGIGSWSARGWNGGSERSGVGTFGETVRDHVEGEGENRIITGPTQANQGAVHVGLDGVGEGSVGLRKSDTE